MTAEGALEFVFARSNVYGEACEQPGHAVFRCIAWLPGLEEEQQDEHDNGHAPSLERTSLAAPHEPIPREFTITKHKSALQNR